MSDALHCHGRPSAVVRALVLAVLAVSCGCAGSMATSSSLVNLDTLKVTGDGWDPFAAGRTTEACEAFWAVENPGPSTWYGRGECSRLLGRYGPAADAYATLFETAPDSAWATFAASRAPEVWWSSPGDRPRRQRACEILRTSQKSSAWARYNGSECALALALRNWRESDDAKPFDGGPYGRPTQWRVVGPTSLRGNLDFDIETAPEKDPVLAGSYELLGFTRKTRFRTSSTSLDLDGLSGIHVAETFLVLERETRLDVVLDYPGLALLRIDGEEILRRDDRDRTEAVSVLTRGVVLSAGAHRITLRVSVERGYKRYVGLTLLAPGGEVLDFRAAGLGPSHPLELPGFASLPERGEVLDQGAPGQWLPVDRTVLPGSRNLFVPGDLGGDPAVLGGVLAVAIAARDEWLVAPVFALLEAAAPEWSGLPMIEHDRANGSWLLPSSLRKKAVLRILRESSEKHPDQNLLRLLLARNLRVQMAKEAAGQSVATLLAAGPDEARNWREAARYYDWRGFSVKAEDAWARASMLDPDDCEAAKELYLVMRARDAAPTQMSATQNRCELTRWYHARNTVRAQGEHKAYLDNLARDVARYPDRAPRWRSWIQAVHAYDRARALVLASSALEWHPHDVDLVAQLADMFDAAGDTARAKEILIAGLEEHAGSQVLHRRLALFGGTLPMQEMLTDGQEAIRAYESDESTLELNASAIFVLDYMARRYFDDGASVDVTHLVVKVLSKEGLDEHGEIAFPRGAVPLMLRTVKKSGQIIEPQLQSGKSKVSMVGLDVGDYVEYAYLSFSGRIPTGRGAAIGPQFFFKMTDIASAHSELIVETPASWEPVFVARNAPPNAEVSDQGQWRRYRFLRKGSVQPRAEPNAVQKQEFLPNLILVHRYGWTQVHRRYQNQLAGTGYLTPAIEETAARVIREAGATSPEAKIAALHAFVVAHVRTPNLRDLQTPAAYILALQEGNPVVLLRCLLRSQGLNASVWLVRPHYQDPVDTESPAFGKYESVLLRVPTEDGDLWLSPVGRHAAYGVLPREMQEAPAINIEPGVEFARETTPTLDPELDYIDTEVLGTLDTDGGLAGTLRVTMPGYSGSIARDRLDRLGPEDQVRKYLERRLNYVISGGELLSWRLGGLADKNEALTIELDFRRAGYAQLRADGAILIEDRYQLPDLTRRYARLAERTVPMLLPRSNHRVRVRLTLPEGREVNLENLGDLDVGSPFGRYVRKVRVVDGVLEFDMSLDISIQRMAPDAYAAFVGWAGDVDRGTYLRIEIQ